MSSWIRRYWLPWSLFLVALVMRLAWITEPAAIVSDEVYFVRDGEHYLTGTYYVDAHPPLGKLRLAAMFTLFGSDPLTWRVLSAIEGALLVPLLWWIVRLLGGGAVAGAAVGTLMLLEGMTLSESRLGLINIPYLLYAFTCVAASLKSLSARRSLGWIALAAATGALAVSVKWIAALIVAPAWMLLLWPAIFGMRRKHPLRLWQWPIVVGLLAIVPLALYLLIWGIHFTWLGVPDETLRTNAYLWIYHNTGNVGNAYSTKWWQWPLLQEPFLFWYKSINGKISALWSLPNPVLWFAAWGIGLLALIRTWAPRRRFLVAMLLFAWVPYAAISRDMFLYHALPMFLWLLCVVALAVEHWWKRGRRRLIVLAGAVAVLGFLWYAPWYYNIPLTPEQYRLRQLWPEWTARHLATPPQ